MRVERHPILGDLEPVREVVIYYEGEPVKASEEEILEAYESRADTVDVVKRRTRAGMGLCQGRTCRLLVSRILAKKKGETTGDQTPPSFRPPVRPIKLGWFE